MLKTSNTWCVIHGVCISYDDLWEHLEPVLITAFACTILLCLAGLWQHIQTRTRGFVARQGVMAPRRSRRKQKQIPVVDLDSDLHCIESFTLPYHEQPQSSLFTILPVEIRDIIYSYTFADYEDLEHAYNFDTCYRRPGYFGPRRSHTAVLRTCQAIYNDCWFMPWTSSQQTFFLAWQSRRPEKTTDVDRLARMVKLIERLHPEVPTRRKEITNVQVFAQLCKLEKGNALSRVLDIEHFKPRTITVTVRHTDIWAWEDDAPIHMDGSQWVWNCSFPTSVKHICFQLESLERKKEQVDYIMSMIQDGWYFTRKDGVRMVAEQSGPTSEVWVGSSTWEGERWVRDEDDRDPGKVRYYVASLCFVPVSEKDQQDMASREKRALLKGLDVSPDVAARTTIHSTKPSLRLDEMENAGVTIDTPASEALHKVEGIGYGPTTLAGNATALLGNNYGNVYNIQQTLHVDSQHRYLYRIVRQNRILSSPCTLETISTFQDGDPPAARGSESQVEIRWERKESLSDGVFGEVHREEYCDAQGNITNRAVKVLRKRQLERLKIDYKKEVDALIQLSKPDYRQFFVEFYAWYEHQAHIFIAMEYVPHGDLEDLVGKGLSESDARCIGYQVLEAINVMHRLDFVHRDIKPANIFVMDPGPSWHVKVGDFGLCKNTITQHTTLHTQVGTDGYKAPEIIGLVPTEKKHQYDQKCDIWSFGCLLYQLITSSVPFRTPTELARYCEKSLSLHQQTKHKNMSRDAENLILLLLRPYPRMRPTADEALVMGDSWFNHHAPRTRVVHKASNTASQASLETSETIESIADTNREASVSNESGLAFEDNDSDFSSCESFAIARSSISIPSSKFGYSRQVNQDIEIYPRQNGESLSHNSQVYKQNRSPHTSPVQAPRTGRRSRSRSDNKDAESTTAAPYFSTSSAASPLEVREASSKANRARYHPGPRLELMSEANRTDKLQQSPPRPKSSFTSTEELGNRQGDVSIPSAKEVVIAATSPHPSAAMMAGRATTYVINAAKPSSNEEDISLERNHAAIYAPYIYHSRRLTQPSLSDQAKSNEFQPPLMLDLHTETPRGPPIGSERNSDPDIAPSGPQEQQCTTTIPQPSGNPKVDTPKDPKKSKRNMFQTWVQNLQAPVAPRQSLTGRVGGMPVYHGHTL